MMKNRYIPFGYTMKNGEMVIEESEAQTIRNIFNSYIAGATLKEIANKLTEDKVVYSEKQSDWNKARIMRIIDNVKYLGDERFEQIIDDKTYSEAVRLKTERQKTHPTDSNEEIKMLKGYIVCGKCGSVMKRRVEKKCKYKERWYCINANCDNNVHIRDSIILKKIKTLLYRMTEDGFEPKERKMPSDDTKEIIRIKSELEQELIKPNGNSQHILDLCIELVGQQYGELKAVASIKAQLEGSETIAEFLSRYVDKILLCEDANATLITKNNIRIEEGG